MSSKKPPSTALQQRIKGIMAQLNKPEFFSDTYVTLYNDLLILKNIVSSVPQNLCVELLRELNSLELSLRETQYTGQSSRFFSGISEPLVTPLDNIMKVLQKVQKKDLLLEDFLTCSGFGCKQSVATN